MTGEFPDYDSLPEPPHEFTEAEVHEILRRSAKGANELRRALERDMQPSAETMALILR